jgi:Na+/melibiose symporter-like transporter
VSLALKINDLVGIDAAPGKLSLVASVGAGLSIIANPVFGHLSDRTTSRWGMRRPWMLLGLAVGSVGILIVAVAPSIAFVLGRTDRGPG